MGRKAYYWQWLKRAVWRAPGIAEYSLSLAGLVVAVIAGVRPEWVDPVNGVWWQVILWTFAAVTLCRFLLAPYWKAAERAALLETSEAARTAEAALVEALRPKEPERNPEGIYQHGRLVGLAQVPRNHGQGMWSFEEITQAVDFDLTLPFEYQGRQMR